MVEIKRKKLPDNSILIDNLVYSTEKLADLHPGGPLFIKAFSGQDASLAFLSYHRKNFPHKKIESALDEKNDSSVILNKTNDTEDFMELCNAIDKVLPRHKTFAPWSYYVKVFFILFGAIGIEVFMHSTISYFWYYSALVGLFYAWIGLNIQHDANHGAISKNHVINRVLGASQNWIGGSAISWIHQHVVQHHIHTNDTGKDPDIAGSVYLRLNPSQPLLNNYLFQHFYFFILLCFYGFSIVVQSLENVVNGQHHTPMSPMLKNHRIFEVFTSALFMLRWVLLPLWQTNSPVVLLSLSPMYIVCGYYLAFFFSLSHNFDGVYMFEDHEKSNIKEKTFLYKQVVSSSNVGGRWLCFFNGGLNYQIEHHLFPRINHSHYPLIAPVVKEFCERKNIPYVHFPTVSENLASAVKHLAAMGKTKRPDSVNFVN